MPTLAEMKKVNTLRQSLKNLANEAIEETTLPVTPSMRRALRIAHILTYYTDSTSVIAAIEKAEREYFI